MGKDVSKLSFPRTSLRFHSALAFLEPQIIFAVGQFGAENISLLSGRLVNDLAELFGAGKFPLLGGRLVDIIPPDYGGFRCHCTMTLKLVYYKKIIICSVKLFHFYGMFQMVKVPELSLLMLVLCTLQTVQSTRERPVCVSDVQCVYPFLFCRMNRCYSRYEVYPPIAFRCRTPGDCPHPFMSCFGGFCF